MCARVKLNGANFTGSILIAGAVGFWLDSFLVFVVAAAILLAANLASRAIRIQPQKRR